MFNQQFPITSRYYKVETATLETEDGQHIVHLRRRFLPDPREFTLLQEHRVQAGERPDNLAAAYLGEAEYFWRLADANGVMDPNELIEQIGLVVRITLPEGIQGNQE